EEQIVAALNASVQEERRQMRMKPIPDSDLSHDISDWGPQTVSRMRAALTAAAGVAPQEPEREHGVIGGEDLLARLMDTLAYYQCRETNPKADHPRMGYHAFSEE